MTTVCVHGLGYIGLPTAAMLANFEHEVCGFDTDPNVVTQLKAGQVHFDEPGLDAFVTRAFEHGTLEVSEEITPAKYHLICVPTPFDEAAQEADLTAVRKAANAITPYLRPGDTVILESTVPPGTTRSVVKPILESTDLRIGSDIGLAHCPETVLPGNVITELRENNRVIGGITPTCASQAVQLYDSFVRREIVTVSDATTAEFVKLIQNTYRDVNIAIANELAKIAGDYGVDSREAIERANLHPRVDILTPGPGVGGHCLPCDSWFLGYDSDHLDLIAAARRVNDGMAEYIIDRLKRDLGTFDGRKIAILGIAYKRNVDDTRRSPGLRIARGLHENAANPSEPIATSTEGSQIAATDGAAPEDRRSAGSSIEIRFCDPRISDHPTVDLQPLDEAVNEADAAIVTVAHDEFQSLKPGDLGPQMERRLLFDTRGIINTTNWTDAGFTVRRL